MQSSSRSILVAAVAATLSACQPVAPIGANEDAGPRPDAAPAVDAPPDAEAAVDAGAPPLPGCTLTDGTRCPLGADCPAGDGCNAARCEPDGGLRVTTIGCGGYCRIDDDCPGGMRCFFSDASSCGGAPGVCRPDFLATCADPQPFCDCQGVTRSGCSDAAFRVRGRGACAAGDAGLADAGACANAQLTADRARCLDDARRELPAACCGGWLCDPRRAFCADPAPACPAGQRPTVRERCWGPCVPDALCDAREAGPTP